jgi:dTDP-4-dehydrorhamnose reductase
VTTFHFAKLCIGIINGDIIIDHLQHIIPNGDIAKADILKVFAKAYSRGDITVNPINAEKVIDRTLSTNNQELNMKIWEASGYKQIPTVEEMIMEMAEWQKRK